METKKWINEEITYINCPNSDARCLVVSYGNGCRIIKGSFDNWVSADSLLVSNEVIKNRAYILKSNIEKSGYHNVVVTQNDPKDFHVIESAINSSLRHLYRCRNAKTVL